MILLNTNIRLTMAKFENSEKFQDFISRKPNRFVLVGWKAEKYPKKPLKQPGEVYRKGITIKMAGRLKVFEEVHSDMTDYTQSDCTPPQVVAWWFWSFQNY